MLSGEELSARCDEVMAWLDAVELGPDWPNWAAVAEQLNVYLGDSWPEPSWDGDQAATVAMCLSLAASSGESFNE